MSKKFLDLDGLSHLWLLITNKLGTKVEKELKTGSTTAYKVLSDNNLTDALVEKINNAGDSTFSGNYDDLVGKPDLTLKEDKANKVTSISATSTNDEYPTAKAVYTELQKKSDVGHTHVKAEITDLVLPTKLSDLTDDLGVVTEEKDPTVPNHVKAITANDIANWNAKSDFDGTYASLTGKPDLTLKEDVSNKTTTVNSASTDAQYPTAKAVYTAVSGKADASILSEVAKTGSYDDLQNKPTIPTNNNQLTNGAGYQTANEVQALINTSIADITGIDFQVVSVVPATGVKGTIYLVSNGGTDQNIYDEYIYTNDKWEKIGTTEVDLSGYVQESDLVVITNAEIDEICA